MTKRRRHDACLIVLTNTKVRQMVRILAVGLLYLAGVSQVLAGDNCSRLLGPTNVPNVKDCASAKANLKFWIKDRESTNRFNQCWNSLYANSKYKQEPMREFPQAKKLIRIAEGMVKKYCAPLAAEKKSGKNQSAGKCSGSASSYVSWRPGRASDGLGGSGYVLENSCKSSAIRVSYITLKSGSCREESNSAKVSAGSDLGDYSYCKARPRITGAEFVK